MYQVRKPYPLKVNFHIVFHFYKTTPVSFKYQVYNYYLKGDSWKLRVSYSPGEGGTSPFFLVGMCRADFTHRSWNWNEGLKSRVIGTKKGGKLVSGTNIWANLELIWAY